MTTFMLAEGGFLTLAAFNCKGDQLDQQLESASLTWREAYLEKTRP